MKFIASTSQILKHSSLLSGVVPSNPMVPILENFLFDLKGNVLTITASDMQTTVSTEVEVEADQDGSVAVPARMLNDTLKNLPEQPVTFHIDLDTYSIEINSDNGKYKLTGENADDFPRVSDLDRSDSLEIPSDVLLDAINYTLFATSNDEMKPAMNGVYFNIQADYTNFVSSDSHRLIRYRRDDLKSSFDASLIVHKRALGLLKAAIPSSGRQLVKLSFNAANAIFSFEGYRMICRLIDERFPDYENVIPNQNNNLVTINRQELLACLKRIVIYANKSTSQVRFKISGNEFRVTAEDLDFSNEADERLYCDHEGDDIEIGFNARFLIEMMNHLHSSKITFKLSEPGMAGLVVPEESADDEDILMLVMPIMLHNYV